VTFDTPVLILAFNRPDRVRELIGRLREIEPAQVYLSVDGPRPSVPDDQTRVREVQDLVRSIDWPCATHTNFLDSNRGCGRAVSSGIDWFFDHVERGIVLEDDVLPSVEFFTFCEELLNRYANDPRVAAISGCNFVPPSELSNSEVSYRFSAITHVWGWATWRRAWRTYEYSMENWRQRLPLKQRWSAMGGDVGGFIYWTAVFDWMRLGKIDTWDYQWSLAQMASGALTATSNVNLVENVGFDGDATHTVSPPAFLRAVEAPQEPLVHPDQVTRDLAADRWVRSQVLSASTSGAWRMVKSNAMERFVTLAHRIRGRS